MFLFLLGCVVLPAVLIVWNFGLRRLKISVHAGARRCMRGLLVVFVSNHEICVFFFPVGKNLFIYFDVNKYAFKGFFV